MHPSPVAPTQATTLPLPPHTGTLLDLAWSLDGRQLAAVSDRGYLCLWQRAAGCLTQRLRLARTALRTVAWTRQPGVLNAGSADGWIYRISRCHAIPPTIDRYRFGASIAKIAWSPSPLGRCLILSGTGLTVLDERGGQSWHARYALSLRDGSWASDGRTFALLREDGQLEIWDARQRCIQAALTDLAGSRCFSWHRDGKRLVVGSASGQIQICDLRTRQRSALNSPLRLPLTAVQWSNTGVIARSTQEMALWEEGSAQVMRHQWERADQACASPAHLRVDPHGEWLAMTTDHALTLTRLGALPPGATDGVSPRALPCARQEKDHCYGQREEEARAPFSSTPVSCRSVLL